MRKQTSIYLQICLDEMIEFNSLKKEMIEFKLWKI